MSGSRPFFLLLTFLSTQTAGAWGHSSDLNQAWKAAHLIFPALEQQEIRYCIQNEAPERFSTTQLDLELNTALNVWLAPLSLRLGGRSVRVRLIPCSSPDLNLKVTVGPESEYPELGAYQIPVIEETRIYSLVKLNSEFIYERENKTYQIVPLSSFLPSDAHLRDTLEKISFSHPETVENFAQKVGFPYRAVFWSSYRVLVHELGHSFGLCDTYEPQFDRCAPDFRSSASPEGQPESVMKTSDFFYLTEDDLAGLEALLERYRKP